MSKDENLGTSVQFWLTGIGKVVTRNRWHLAAFLFRQVTPDSVITVQQAEEIIASVAKRLANPDDVPISVCCL
jgi:hypothetical protein